MVDVFPEPLAMLKREHDEEKKKLEELKGEISALKGTHGRNFQELPQKARSLFLSIESELLIHMRKEEEGLFPIMRGDEDELWNLSPFIIEHYELVRMAKEIHEIIDTLNGINGKDESGKHLIKRLCVKTQLFGGFLSHHMEMEENVLFPMALEAMSEAELSHAHRLMRILETWPSRFLRS